MREIRKIIVHCSASDFGNAEIIRKWHLERGFVDIGYHYVILNGVEKQGKYRPERDGVIEEGRPIEQPGAHCKGHNKDSIGICLIGNCDRLRSPFEVFTQKQLMSLAKLLKELMVEYRIPKSEIYGHNDFANKLCPCFKMRDYIDNILELAEQTSS